LYRSSEHGFKATDFHAKCDYKSNTFTIIKSSNGNIFGGYTNACWDSNKICHYKYDSEAFLFSLVNVHKQPVKINISQNFEKAIYCSKRYGIAFGSEATELAVPPFNENDMRNGYSNLGKSRMSTCYQLGNNSQLNNITQRAFSDFLAGSNRFEIVDIEVFQQTGLCTRV
jgi:hypothetical protein